ncbi:MAG: hypothetical protein IPO35_17660 [Uliginosibacterium sp.]|nr:hypothetical protein [Uliginosibacterium sp.]
MAKRTYHNGQWDGNSIFVFGSNLAGRHGAGAAKFAVQYARAVYGAGVGYQGNCYAIPTKDKNIVTLPLCIIKEYVDDFIEAAADNFEDTFFVTAIGTGLAGYSSSEIAPMFKDAPENCVLPNEWKEIIEGEG